MNLALFDLDGTLLPGDSDHAFGEFMVAWAGPMRRVPAAQRRLLRRSTWRRLDITPTSTSPPRPGATARRLAERQPPAALRRRGHAARCSDSAPPW
jgi:FMN phosphatase YigB (HAD superfamily)